MRRPSRKTHEGMSLVEVLVAVTVLAMIGTLLVAGFVQTAKNKKRIEEEADYHHVINAAVERMQREISMAFVSIHQNPSQALVVQRTAFIGTDRSDMDRLNFTSFSHQRLYRDAPESDQNEISYFIARDPETNLDALVRREQRRINDDPEHGGRVQIMVPEVRGLDFEYLDPQTWEWQRTWDTTQVTAQPNRLPVQVQITLTVPEFPKRNAQPGDERPDRVIRTRAVLPLNWALNHAAYL
ncbi:MAG: type II secretion system protein GspJ [Myxococcota bacterium]